MEFLYWECLSDLENKGYFVHPGCGWRGGEPHGGERYYGWRTSWWRTSWVENGIMGGEPHGGERYYGWRTSWWRTLLWVENLMVEDVIVGGGVLPGGSALSRGTPRAERRRGRRWPDHDPLGCSPEPSTHARTHAHARTHTRRHPRTHAHTHAHTHTAALV